MAGFLEFANVTKVYEPDGERPIVALHPTSFSVQEGEVVAIVGRSGSGKSTLLHLSAGIDVPTDGAVTFDGTDLGRLTERQRTQVRRDRIGLVFQFFHLVPHLSVEDNVALPEFIAGGRPRDFAPRVRELLQRVGLGDRARDSVQQLSGGEMQRVAICRALLRRPRLILADEPTGNLDDENSTLVMDLIMQLVATTGSTLIYVTHSRELAQRADRTWVLHSGTLES